MVVYEKKKKVFFFSFQILVLQASEFPRNSVWRTAFYEGRDTNPEDTQKEINQGELQETRELFIWIEYIGIAKH